jgi:hypothetical protein
MVYIYNFRTSVSDLAPKCHDIQELFLASTNIRNLYTVSMHLGQIFECQFLRWVSQLADKQIVKKNVGSGKREQQGLFQDIISMASTIALLISIH